MTQQSRIIPHDIDIEKQILGILLVNNNKIDLISDYTSPEQFYIPINGKIYEIILQLRNKNLVASITTIKGYVSRENGFDTISAAEYLRNILDSTPSLADIKTLCTMLNDLFIRRQLIEISEHTANYCYDTTDPNITSEVCLEKMEQSLFSLALNNSKTDQVRSIYEASKETLRCIEVAMKSGKSISGIDTGFYDMNKLTGGLRGSDLIIIAGRPSMGKTAFALKLAYNVAQKCLDSGTNIGVGLFSLEMSSQQLANRIISFTTDIEGHRLNNGMVDKASEILHLNQGIAELENLPLYIDDTAALTISEIRTRARRMKRKHNIGLIVVDYLQLVKPARINYNANKVHEIGDISQGLKAIAKELNIPVIALSQLSRSVESRQDKRPMLQDLRDSGNIEQDADIVCFIYREAYYLRRELSNDKLSDKDKDDIKQRYEEVENEAEIIIAKQRNGPIGSFLTYFNGATTDFDNYKQ